MSFSEVAKNRVRNRKIFPGVHTIFKILEFGIDKIWDQDDKIWDQDCLHE